MGFTDLAHDEAEGTLIGHDGSGLLIGPDGHAMPARFHALCQLFPVMPQAEFDSLVADVKANGVRRPIVLLDGQILDGRHRYLAAREAGASYRTVEFTGADPVAFVLSENLRRRHLNESQRAMIAAKLANMRPGRPSENAQTCAVTQPDAAEMLSVSRRSVQTAAEVQEKAEPEVQALVESGDLSVSAAAAVATLPPERQRDVAAMGPPAARGAAREVRAKRQEERWRDRVAKLLARASAHDDDPDRPDLPLSVAVHLVVKGERVEIAETLARRAGVSVASIRLAVKMLTQTPEDAEREAAEVGRVICGIMADEGRTEERTTYSRVIDQSPAERLEQAWRSGWVAAVLGRKNDGGGYPTGQETERVWATGWREFHAQFRAFMAADTNEQPSPQPA